jgi:hypothetical protein
VLAVGSGVVATLLAGRYLADVGTFSAALGLSIVSLCGNPAGALIVPVADVNRHYEFNLAATLAVESVAWFLVILACLIVTGFVTRWLLPREGADQEEGRGVVWQDEQIPAIGDVPWMSHKIYGDRFQPRTSLDAGLRHLGVAVVFALALMALLSAGLSTRTITHGQACFIVAASLAVASQMANRFAPVQSSFWSLLAVPLVAILGFAWAALRPGEANIPAILPSSHYLRILPIQYIAVGTAAVVMMSWYALPPQEIGHGSRRTPRRPLSAGHGRV